MNAIKKTILATAILMSMSAGAAQAVVTNYNFVGSFVMFDGYEPNYNNPTAYIGWDGSTIYNIIDNGNGIAGDPVVGTMSIDSTTGSGSIALNITQPFIGAMWDFKSGTLSPGDFANTFWAKMQFSWNNHLGCVSEYCTIHNMNMLLSVMPTADPLAFNVFTVERSYLYDGGWSGFEPTFHGVATISQTPLPTAAWLLGSGLLGLIGVARRKAA